MPCPYGCEAVGEVDIKAKALSYEGRGIKAEALSYAAEFVTETFRFDVMPHLRRRLTGL